MKIAVIVLSLMLVVTNVFWVYTIIDNAVTATYREQQLHEEQETRKQLSLMLPEASQGLSKEQLVAIAEKHSGLETFEKDGCTWVGWLGLKFNANGKLESVSPTWSFGDEDPCYPAF